MIVTSICFSPSWLSAPFRPTNLHISGYNINIWNDIYIMLQQKQGTSMYLFCVRWVLKKMLCYQLQHGLTKLVLLVFCTWILVKEIVNLLHQRHLIDNSKHLTYPHVLLVLNSYQKYKNAYTDLNSRNSCDHWGKNEANNNGRFNQNCNYLQGFRYSIHVVTQQQRFDSKH